MNDINKKLGKYDFIKGKLEIDLMKDGKTIYGLTYLDHEKNEFFITDTILKHLFKKLCIKKKGYKGLPSLFIMPKEISDKLIDGKYFQKDRECYLKKVKE